MAYRPLSERSIARNLRPRRIGREVVVLKSVGSTNDWMKAAAAEGAREGIAVFAEEQSAGRGQAGRAWSAPAGGCLLMSVLLRPTVPVERLPYLTMLGACAAAAAIVEQTGLPITLKWPNDLIGARGKVGGVLTEASFADAGLDYVVLGIGLNVNLARRALSAIPGADSLQAGLGRRVNRNGLARSVLRALDERYASLESGASGVIFDEWKGRLRTLGQWVTLTRGPAVEGPFLAQDVTDSGALVLARPDGSTFEIVAGEVSARPAPDRLGDRAFVDAPAIQSVQSDHG